MERILVVDDEEEIRELVGIYLKNEGYEITLVSNGIEALRMMKEEGDRIQLIILDIMMPIVNGIDTCLELRKKYNIPIIMLSAKAEDIDKIMGLSVGADDYLTKPFNPLELIARVKAQLRRATKLNDFTIQKKTTLISDELVMNIEVGKVYKRGIEVSLTPTEYSILKLLWVNKGITFKTEEIYERVWAQEPLSNNNTVMVHIRKIREKIEDNPREPIYVFTVWGVGYKFEGV